MVSYVYLKHNAVNRKARLTLSLYRAAVYAVLIFLTILCLFSFYLLFVNSTRSNAQLQAGFRILPRENFLNNLVNAWNDVSISIPVGLKTAFSSLS